MVEDAKRPTMNFVTVKSVEQQDIQAVHRVRELLGQQRTTLINEARGLLAERGVSIAQSRQAFKRDVHKAISGCAWFRQTALIGLSAVNRVCWRG